MAPFTGVPTQRQQVVLALAPKFAAVLSILGSSYILYDCIIVKLRKRSRKNVAAIFTYQRLMAGLCACDIFMSFGFLMSTWVMPSSTPNVWGAVGTVESCEAIGFLEQAGVSAVMYNASLSIYFLLRISWGWTNTKFRRIELLLHMVPICFGLGTMIASLQLDLFNSGLFDCWIAPFPQGCNQSWQNDGEADCERGDNASLYQYWFDLGPKSLSIIIVTLNMWWTHRRVLQVEQASISRRFSNEDTRPKVARRIARQSYFYVGALYLTYIPVIVARVHEYVAGTVHYEMILTISITIPLQGLWNFIVYLRPRFLRKREEQRKLLLRQGLTTAHEGSSDINRYRGNFAKMKLLACSISEAVKEGYLSEDHDGVIIDNAKIDDDDPFPERQTNENTEDDTEGNL